MAERRCVLCEETGPLFAGKPEMFVRAFGLGVAYARSDASGRQQFLRELLCLRHCDQLRKELIRGDNNV